MSQPRPIDRQAWIRIARLSGLVSLAALGLSACASLGPSSLADAGGGGQGPSARSGLHGVDKPYEVDGRWYYPHAQPDYDVVGLASWYGAQFHNHHTADGEIFDQWGLSAAHKTLPLPCIVEVTNLENGKRMRLRVNDRGPFVDERVIDVSRAAAESLGFRERGVTRVRVRYVGPAPALPTVLYARNDQAAPSSPAARGGYVARDEIEQVPAAPARSADDADDAQPAAPTLPPPSPLTPATMPAAAPQPLYAEADDQAAPPPSGPVGYAAPATPVQPSAAPPMTYAEAEPQLGMPPPAAPVTPAPVAAPPASAYAVQAAAFASYDNAQRAASRLAQAGAASIRTTTNSQGQILYRVVVAGYPDADAAEAGRARIAAAGFGDARVIAPF